MYGFCIVGSMYYFDQDAYFEGRTFHSSFVPLLSSINNLFLFKKKKFYFPKDFSYMIYKMKG